MKTVKLEVVQLIKGDKLVYEAYWLDDKLHNSAGPAVRQWNDAGRLVHEEFWLDGKCHNPDGPAYRKWDDAGQLIREEFYLNGEQLIKEKWQSRTQSCSGKIIEVEGKQYKLVEVSE